MKTLRLNFNDEYDFEFLIKLLQENHPESGAYRKIQFKPKFSEHTGAINHLSVEFESVYMSGENNFNEH